MTDDPREDGSPPLGARLVEGGVRFRAFSTSCRTCSVRLFDEGDAVLATHAMRAAGAGFFELFLSSVQAGARYKLVLDDRELPDPFARWLPGGVHGPAVVFDSSYTWRHPAPRVDRATRVIYELHVGTFTTAGTYAAAREMLPALARLGVTTIELMPLSAAAGGRGWGYDGVAHFAPFPSYGTPDELRDLVDTAHGHGLELIVDVVYNHFGPAGNYLGAYAPEYFRHDVKTPWGDAIDYRHPVMRRYVLDNVEYWLSSMRFDGLRLDAIFAIFDDSPTHLLREIVQTVRRRFPDKTLIAEDERNDPATIDGLGFDAVWADDFHHSVHVTLTGERDGYYAAYQGGAAEIAETITNGWLYRGQTYPPSGKARGYPADRLEPRAFVYCIQNHDQIGNRASGDRLSSIVSLDAYCAASALLLFLPMTPLLFMGDEWAASTPFAYFTDHEAALGRAVTEGRRREFESFGGFSAGDHRVLDPQAASTFAASRLSWAERHEQRYARVLVLYHELLRLRRTDAVLAAPCRRADLSAEAFADVLVCQRRSGQESRILVVNMSHRGAQVPREVVTRPRKVLLDTTSALQLLEPGGALAPWQAVIGAA